MAKVTLEDIARVCNVDISTASRALRGDPRVTAATGERIQAAAHRLGYRPNLLARNLAGGSTRTIWFVIPSLDSPVDARLVVHLSHRANAMDYSIFAALHDADGSVTGETHNAAHYAQIISQAGQGLVDGVVILPRRYFNDAELLRDLVRHDVPVVFIDNYVEELPVPVVTTDNESVARELARRCVEAGAKEAVLLFDEPNPVARVRLASAQAALRELNVPVFDKTRLPAGWTPSQLGSSVAIIGSAQGQIHEFAVHHAQHLTDRHLIIGVFDDWLGEPAPAEKVIIAVQDCKAMANGAVDRLIARIEKKPLKEPRVVHMPVLEFKTLATMF